MFCLISLLFVYSQYGNNSLIILIVALVVLLSNKGNETCGFSLTNINYHDGKGCNSNTGPPPSTSWLAKTTETFKLADLQYLEMKFQHGDCQRLLMDATTGSMLLQFDNNPINNHYTNTESSSSKVAPSSASQRCEWIAQVIAHGATPIDLIQNMANSKKQSNGLEASRTTRQSRSSLSMEDIRTSNSYFTKNTRIEPSRLGKCHESLESFMSAVPYQQQTSKKKKDGMKEFSLVVVTDLSNTENQRPILLGMKNRGFGKGFYTSVAGKNNNQSSDDNGNQEVHVESDAECASRELQEEAGIKIPSSTMAKHKIGKLSFTFDDDVNHEIMLMHVFRIDVITTRTTPTTTTATSKKAKTCSQSSMSSIEIDPNIHELVKSSCDNDITPVWFQNWYDIPLDEMFIDNSIWLTHILTNHDTTYFDGYFHYESGGQTNNSIQHYHVTINTNTKKQNSNPLKMYATEKEQPLHSTGGWVLDYIRMQNKDSSPASSKNLQEGSSSHHYTSKSLMCCISQQLPTPAALNPKLASEILMIIDTGSTDHGIFLVRKIDHSPLSSQTRKEGDKTFLSSGILQTYESNDSSNNNNFAKVWAKRPFQYSSAINPAIAEIVVDLLIDMVQRKRQQAILLLDNATKDGHVDDGKDTITLLDPACGSGTFLALAVLKGIQAEGWDINPLCVAGTTRNLEYALIETNDIPCHKPWKVELCDATQSLQRQEEMQQQQQSQRGYDCVVANLPWGQNTISYHEENKQILWRLSKCLSSGTPCAFVSKSAQQVEEDLKHFGFIVKGQAHIPQRNFRLPRGTKKNKKKKTANHDGNKGKSQDRKGSTSDCVVTIAISP